uniref:hypothetical protein n=1 Tax=Lachnospira sp. TaxID=2049031 RepID=UPI00402667F2
MEDFVIVLSVGRPYDIASEDGSHITGCTMSYIATQDINQISENPDSGELGYVPVKERMPVDFYERAKAQGLPATAKVVYGMKNSGGKQTLFIKGLDFVGNKPSK